MKLFAPLSPLLAAFLVIPASAAVKTVSPIFARFQMGKLPHEDLSCWRLSQRWLGGPVLSDGTRRLEWLGSGTFGDVFVHPHRPEAVVKVLRNTVAKEVNPMSRDDSMLESEDLGLAEVAKAGAAPMPLAHATIDGHSASVRERIFGHTVAELGRRRQFGPGEYKLVRRMIDIIASAGLEGEDLKLDNLMIGHRATNERRQAWFVDPLTVHVKSPSDSVDHAKRMLNERLRPHGLVEELRQDTLTRALERLVRRSRR